MVAVGGFIYRIVVVPETFEMDGKQYYSQIDHADRIIWLSAFIPPERREAVRRRAIQEAIADVRDWVEVPPIIGETET